MYNEKKLNVNSVLFQTKILASGQLLLESVDVFILEVLVILVV